MQAATTAPIRTPEQALAGFQARVFARLCADATARGIPIEPTLALGIAKEIAATDAAELLREIASQPAADGISPHAPGELWTLNVINDDPREGEVGVATDPDHFVPPVDDPGVRVFMVCTSKADVERLAEHQESYGIDCVPVRIK